MTICSRTVDYCFPYCFWNLLESNNSETEYRNATFFPERVVEILKIWAPPRQVTFKCPRPGFALAVFSDGDILK